MRSPATRKEPRTEDLYYTYADLADTPDDRRRYEIIDGELIVTPSPKTAHQVVVGNLFLVLGGYLARKKLGRVFLAPLDVVFSEINVVEPDMFFVSNERLHRLGEANLQGAPDLAIEVLSKGTQKRDRETKRRLYARFGVSHYWIVDPVRRELEEHVLEGRRYLRRSRLEGAATFTPALFSGLKIRLSKVWPG